MLLAGLFTNNSSACEGSNGGVGVETKSMESWAEGDEYQTRVSKQIGKGEYEIGKYTSNSINVIDKWRQVLNGALNNNTAKVEFWNFSFKENVLADDYILEEQLFIAFFRVQRPCRHCTNLQYNLVGTFVWSPTDKVVWQSLDPMWNASFKMQILFKPSRCTVCKPLRGFGCDG